MNHIIQILELRVGEPGIGQQGREHGSHFPVVEAVQKMAVFLFQIGVPGNQRRVVIHPAPLLVGNGFLGRKAGEEGVDGFLVPAVGLHGPFTDFVGA